MNENKLNILIVITALSLLFSGASLTLSTLTYTDLTKKQHTGHEHKVDSVITKKYAKGKTYKKAVKTKKPMIVFFYTDWCGYCKQFAPTFNKIAKKEQIKKNFAIAYVDCQNEKNGEIITEYGIRAFPTVYVVNNDKRIKLDNFTFFQQNAEELVTEELLKTLEK